MTPPKTTGWYKATSNNVECFAFYSTETGWHLFSEPESWRVVKYETVLFENKIMFAKN